MISITSQSYLYNVRTIVNLRSRRLNHNYIPRTHTIFKSQITSKHTTKTKSTSTLPSARNFPWQSLRSIRTSTKCISRFRLSDSSVPALDWRFHMYRSLSTLSSPYLCISIHCAHVRARAHTYTMIRRSDPFVVLTILFRDDQRVSRALLRGMTN